jgi:hypothetical protein
LTGGVYVGKANSDDLFIERQYRHDLRFGIQHNYDILGRADPGTALDVLEESFIRQLGGPRSTGGILQNMRHQMSDIRYRAAGGAVPY